jgi:hypothetical protein
MLKDDVQRHWQQYLVVWQVNVHNELHILPGKVRSYITSEIEILLVRTHCFNGVQKI